MKTGSSFCIRCLYCLDSTRDRRCPECGQSFDWDDPTSYYSDRVPGIIGRHLLRAPGWVTYIAVGALLSLNIVYASGVAASASVVGCVSVWVGITCVWLVRLLLFHLQRDYYGAFRKLGIVGWTRWVGVPCVCLLAIVTIWADVPIRTRFALSQNELQAFVDAIRATGTAPTQIQGSGIRLGLYSVQDAVVMQDMVWLTMEIDSYGNQHGFAHCPHGEPPASGDMCYYRLKDDWYLWYLAVR